MNWYSGGNERKKLALESIAKIITDLTNESDRPLKEVLKKFSNQLEQNQESVPLTLSRMNIAVSDCLVKNKIALSEINRERLKEIFSLSEIRYGY